MNKACKQMNLIAPFFKTTSQNGSFHKVNLPELQSKIVHHISKNK